MIRNGWYPGQSFGNLRVPDDGKVIGSLVTMSGEVINTYFEKDGQIYVVCDWVGQRPQLVPPDKLPSFVKETLAKEEGK